MVSLKSVSREITDLHRADDSKLNILGAVTTMVSAQSSMGRGIREHYLSYSALKGLGIVNDHFPEPSLSNRQ